MRFCTRRCPVGSLGQVLIVLAVVCACCPRTALAQDDVRTRYTINEDWKFLPQGLAFGQRPSTSDDGWETVSVPHTWNADDPFDDEESYRRGISWYRKRIRLDRALEGKRLFLHFEGVNQEADVYVNGAFAGNHRGGYTAFTVDITDLVTFDGAGNENLIAVQVDNSHDNYIPPLSVGYALYGGIYRDVWLVATDPVHVDMLDHGSSGVFVSTPDVSVESATVDVRGTIVNDGTAPKTVRVEHRILDADGRAVQTMERRLDVDAGGKEAFAQEGARIVTPHLWSPEDPYLYTVVTDVYDGDRLVDRVESPLGFRWFRFDPDTGFWLNGESYRLKGTNRHQDYAGRGPALGNRTHVSDLRWIKDMGANFLRLAHYPQDPAVLEAADRMGLLVWEEIPLVNYMTISPRFLANTKDMLRDMIRQHYNHPSVVLWGSMNEVFLWSEQGARIRNHTDKEYGRQVVAFSQALDSLIRAEDPGRYTAMAIHASDYYREIGLEEIPQVVGINMYNGWYGGEFDGFGRALDRRHARSPEQVIFVSEYGAGSDVRINSLAPERFDFSGNWKRLYHESYIRQMRERPYLAGTAIWNQFDFSQPHTGGTISHLNQKGMLTWDRKPKDVYYLYKANWNPEPMVHVASHDWTQRVGDPSTPQPVDVYSNLEAVELFHNGTSLGVKTPDDVKKASWQVSFVEGENVIEARARAEGRTYEDRVEIDFAALPFGDAAAREAFDELAVNVGSRAQMADGDRVWVADRPYGDGGYGYIGGERDQFHKDLIIRGTDKTPLYFTFQSGLTGYRVDVPDGTYEVELHFAESVFEAGERVFSVTVNGDTIASHLDLARERGLAWAAPLRVHVKVSDGRGLRIGFDAVREQPILNALRVKKL